MKRKKGAFHISFLVRATWLGLGQNCRVPLLEVAESRAVCRWVGAAGASIELQRRRVPSLADVKRDCSPFLRPSDQRNAFHMHSLYFLCFQIHSLCSAEALQMRVEIHVPSWTQCLKMTCSKGRKIARNAALFGGHSKTHIALMRDWSHCSVMPS